MGLSMVVSPHEPPQYRHKNSLKITEENGNISAYVAWWADDPLASAICEGRRAVCALEKYGIAGVRQVRDRDDKVLFECRLHPLRAKQLGR